MPEYNDGAVFNQGGTVDYTQFLNHNDHLDAVTNIADYTLHGRDYITTDRITINPDIFNTHPIDYNEIGIWQDTTIDAWQNLTTMNILERKLDEFAKRLYKIIDEHTHIDIEEDEFMNLLLKGDD